MRGVFLLRSLRVLLSLCLIITLLFAGCGGFSRPASTDGDVARCRRFLTDCGWTLSPAPPEISETVLSADRPAVFTRYNDLQKKQGYDLTPYLGVRLKKIVFSVLDYPGLPPDVPVLATVFVYAGKIVGGDIGCPALSGFQHGFLGESAYDENAAG